MTHFSETVRIPVVNTPANEIGSFFLLLVTLYQNFIIICQQQIYYTNSTGAKCFDINIPRVGPSVFPVWRHMFLIKMKIKIVQKMSHKKEGNIHSMPSRNIPCLIKQIIKTVYLISIDTNKKNFVSILKTLRLRNWRDKI